MAAGGRDEAGGGLGAPAAAEAASCLAAINLREEAAAPANAFAVALVRLGETAAVCGFAGGAGATASGAMLSSLAAVASG